MNCTPRLANCCKSCSCVPQTRPYSTAMRVPSVSPPRSPTYQEMPQVSPRQESSVKPQSAVPESQLPAGIPQITRKLRPSSFYMRPLPTACVAFGSSEGKEVFRNALHDGYMEGYFDLASQHLTQNEPAFCGLGTLCLILNALHVDPHRQWKGPWRWYEQEMLHCCRTLEDVKSHGITIDEFTCLARCNGLHAQQFNAPEVQDPENDPVDLTQFREHLKQCLSSNKVFIALAFSRKLFGQTGVGHFSPIAGYSEKDDRVLILDVARFKYPSYWVSTETAFRAMLPRDKTTSKPRGYVMLSIDEGNSPNPNAPSTTLNFNKSSWSHMSAIIEDATKNTTSLDSLVTTILVQFAGHPVPPLIVANMSGVHPLQNALSRLPLSHRARELGAPEEEIPWLVLVTLAYLNAPSTFIPEGLRGPAKNYVAQAKDRVNVSTESELTWLTAQLDALSVCC